MTRGGVFSLLRPELISIYLYKFLVIPVRCTEKQSPNLHKKGKTWGILAVSNIIPTYKSM